jgi:hypothetical protein
MVSLSGKNGFKPLAAGCQETRNPRISRSRTSCVFTIRAWSSFDFAVPGTAEIAAQYQQIAAASSQQPWGG